MNVSFCLPHHVAVSGFMICRGVCACTFSTLYNILLIIMINIQYIISIHAMIHGTYLFIFIFSRKNFIKKIQQKTIYIYIYI